MKGVYVWIIITLVVGVITGITEIVPVLADTNVQLPLFSDNFIEKNGSQAKNWTVARGVFEVINGTYNVISTNGSGNSNPSYSYLNNSTLLNSSSYWLNVSVRRNGTIDSYGFAAIYFNFKGLNFSHIGLTIRQTGYLQIYQKKSYGSLNYSLANISFPKDNDWHDISIRLQRKQDSYNGAVKPDIMSMSVYDNGNLIIDRLSARDYYWTSDNLSEFEAGTIGLGSVNFKSSFRNVTLKLIPDIINVYPTYFYSQSQIVVINVTAGRQAVSVKTPAGRVFYKTIDSDSQYYDINYPTDFPGADMSEKGKYIVNTSTGDNSFSFDYNDKPVLSFVTIGDIHYNKTTDKNPNASIDAFISQINNEKYFPKPDFVAIVGDATDHGYLDEMQGIKSKLDQLSVPYYPIAGNHDCNNNNGSNWYSVFGPKYNYSDIRNGYLLVFAGVGYCTYRPLVNNIVVYYGSYGLGYGPYINWFNKTVSNNPYLPTFVFSHYPALPPRTSGGGQVLAENQTTGVVTNATLNNIGSVPMEISSHTHLNARNKAGNVTYIVDGASISSPNEHKYIEIYPTKIKVHTVGVIYSVNVPIGQTYWQGVTDDTHDNYTYTFGNPDERDFEIELVNITSDRYINLWNFTAKNVQVDKITLGNNSITSNTVKVNLSPYETRKILNMTVVTGDDILMNVTVFNTTGDQRVKFNESSTNNDAQASYVIGDRTKNQSYSVSIYWGNGTIYQDFDVLANASFISYNSTGFDSSRYQEINIVDTSFTVTLPIGYELLRFNSSRATVKNLDPDGQTSLRPMFNVANSGNVIQNFGFYLNGTVSNVTTYIDLDNDHTNGRIEINTSMSNTIIQNLDPDTSQNVWIIIDANNAPMINANRALTMESARVKK